MVWTLVHLTELLNAIVVLLTVVLQAKSSAYTGILLPNINIIKTLLERLRDGNSLKYVQTLVQALLRQQSAIKGFAARFSHLYED